jgi:hypothetical protein
MFSVLWNCKILAHEEKNLVILFKNSVQTYVLNQTDLIMNTWTDFT